MLPMWSHIFTHIRLEDDGNRVERQIRGMQYGPDVLRVALGEDVRPGDLIEDRVGELVKRMEVLDVIPQRPGGTIGAFNHYLEIRYEVRSRADVTPPKQFEVSSLHPQIALIATPRLQAGHGNDAVLRAFEAIEARIKKLTGLPDIGKDLVNKVFKQSGDALLDVSSDDVEESSRPSERDGYRFLFLGATLGIRNIHAHNSRPEISPAEAFELLALASHLMRRLDVAESRLERPDDV